ncbi:MAG: hypothetical protein H7338_04765 [Candidatus Sericytochromatia bacterium]|nr:hypothetical protein [Candidatus Sericytochromatia bacterium]
MAETIAAARRVIGTIGNETANVNMFQTKVPGAINAWIHTVQPTTSPLMAVGTHYRRRFPMPAGGASGKLVTLAHTLPLTSGSLALAIGTATSR